MANTLLCDKVGGLRESHKGIETDTCVYITHDTVEYYKPIAKDSAVIRYTEVRLAVYDTIQRDIGRCDPCVDSAVAMLPITQKVFSDSGYTAYISGYEPSLDSLKVYPKSVIREIYIKPQPKHWHIGVSAGGGYTRHGFTPFVGVSLTYSILSF